VKVYLSKPRSHWISPYTLIDYAFFWTDWSKCSRSKEYIPDEQQIDHPKWVEKLSDKIEPVSKAIQWVLNKIHPPIEYVKIDYWDVWSMDSTLSPIILPMLKQLKKVKHGSGYVDLEDVPEHLRYTSHQDWDDNRSFDFYNEDVPKGPDVHTRYDWMLDELIWTFEQLADEDNGEGQFWEEHGEIDWSEHPEDKGKTSRPLRWLKESKVDWEGLRKHQERVSNGVRLFGKYYQTLWD
jgi:hypothetical protein